MVYRWVINCLLKNKKKDKMIIAYRSGLASYYFK